MRNNTTALKLKNIIHNNKKKRKKITCKRIQFVRQVDQEMSMHVACQHIEHREQFLLQRNDLY
jgi:hypothetical protein